MSSLLGRIAIRLALCGLLMWLNVKLLRWLEMPIALGFIWTAPMIGVALAKPLIDLFGELRHSARRVGLRHLEGRHYAFRGHLINVIEDADHQRWVRLADVRSAIGFTASDASLQVTYPAGFRRLGKPPEPHLGDEALLAHLAKLRTPVAIRFHGWVEREIVFPARRERSREGIKLEALDFRPSD